MLTKLDLENRANLQRVRASLRLRQLSKFKSPPVVEIKEIPLDWTKFPGTENDFWKITESKDSKAKSCLYDMDVNSFFATHLHPEKVKIEAITLLSKEAEIEFVTEDKISFYKYPDSFECPANELHALVNLSKKRIQFKVDWFPVMDNWVGVFPTLKEN